jgi:hypothetical protein
LDARNFLAAAARGFLQDFAISGSIHGFLERGISQQANASQTKIQMKGPANNPKGKGAYRAAHKRSTKHPMLDL